MDRAALRDHVDQAARTARPEFGSFFLAKLLDLTISYDDHQQSCTVRLPHAPMLLNPQGSVHGGILTTVLDISMGHLCNRFLSTAVTLDMNTRFFRPVTSDSHSEARVLKPGRTIVHLESRLYDAEGRLAAHATGTWHRLSTSHQQSPEVPHVSGTNRE
ncbi:PaaI family thioesterase [Halostreptopolyspora alba]|uniref:PaaI family thioesterase n=1 Tax=Halostreptopolyspora alba TaxID=2487137 RepID=A0A3N0EEE9_9ACTN|nr:PaaI family thioesterase [Nocardiopsaceae bacterium YIM 96095]